MNGQVVVNTTYYLELFVTDSDGSPVNGISASFTIYKASDNSVISSGSLTDKSNGTYQNSYTFTETGQFYVIYTTPSGYTDEIETLNIVEETAKETDLMRLLGLSDENKRIINTVHDANGQITSAIVKLYPSKTDYENDTNVFATYEYEATYNASGLMQTMGIKRTS